jgi:hypothetical protein
MEKKWNTDDTDLTDDNELNKKIREDLLHPCSLFKIV